MAQGILCPPSLSSTHFLSWLLSQESSIPVAVRLLTSALDLHCSVTQSCPTTHHLMNCSTPGLPVLYYLLLKLTSIESMMPSVHFILCRPILLLPSVFPIIRVFSNESALCNNPSVPTLFLLVVFVFSRDSSKQFILQSLVSGFFHL